MPTTRHLTTGALLLGAALLPGLATACGNDTEPTVTGPVIVQHQDESGDSAAGLLEGTLAVASGCLTVNEDLLVLTESAAWDEDTQTIAFDSGTTWAVGDEVKVAGGEYTTIDEAADVLGEDAIDALRSCANAPVWWGTPS